MAETKMAEPGVRVATASTGGPTSAQTLSNGFRDLIDSAKQMSSAQMAIWGLKAQRMAALAGLGLVGLILMVLLLAYGFTLLDQAFDYGLVNAGLPLWASPLIRGGIYLGLPLIGLLLVWHTMIGYGRADKELRGEETRKA